jgi:hypothetical protein
LKREETTKMTKNKIRKEIKYSDDEWNKVIALSKERGLLPAAYIREQAVNTKIKIRDELISDNDFTSKRSEIYWGINHIAKVVNSEKTVYSKDVEEVEKIIDKLGNLANNELRPIVFKEVTESWLL